MTESQIHTSSAYILFYKRKDLGQKPIAQIVPRLNVTKFPGMPVRIRPGYLTNKELNGYLIEYRRDHSQVIFSRTRSL